MALSLEVTTEPPPDISERSTISLRTRALARWGADAGYDQALSKLTDEREVSGRSVDTVLRDAEYFMHGEGAELRLSPIDIAHVQGAPAYNLLKQVFGGVSWLQANPNNPNAPP